MLSEYEQETERNIEAWQKGDDSTLRQAINAIMSPVDWATERWVPPDMLRQADDAVSGFVEVLGDAAKWTVSLDGVLEDAHELGIEANSIESLRYIDLEKLDPLAQKYADSNALVAAIEGGGAGLGGVAFIAADVPALLTINLRLTLQIAAVYGFDLRSTEYQPLIMAILNVAASGTPAAKHQALREMSVAGSAFAAHAKYLGRVQGAFSAQNRHVPREIAKQLLGRKLAQMIPLAGAAIGAGVNYWFTGRTADAATMCMRSLNLECRRRQS